MKKVLLVENDASNIELTKRLVKDICEIECAINSFIAVECAKKEQFSAILLDINLGLGPDGIDTLLEIRKIPGYEKTPVIVITAYALQHDKDKIMEHNIDYYLVKPINISQFKELLKNVLN